MTIIGKSAHGAMPASGVNGATYPCPLPPANLTFAGPAKDHLDIAEILERPHEGTNLQVAHVDEKMGALS